MKKNNKLPAEVIVDDKYNNIKSIILILFFVINVFYVPNGIPFFAPYLIMFLLVIIFNYKQIICDFKLFVKNKKVYIPYVIKNYFKMLGAMILVAIPISILNSGNTSGNQQLVNYMFKKAPIIIFLSSTLYAPFVEENVFRLAFLRIFKNKYVFIILSSFVFGLLHVIDTSSSIYQFLYIFQYMSLGYFLANAYYNSKNIFVPMSMHFIQNFISAILILLLHL